MLIHRAISVHNQLVQATSAMGVPTGRGRPPDLVVSASGGMVLVMLLLGKRYAIGQFREECCWYLGQLHCSLNSEA